MDRIATFTAAARKLPEFTGWSDEEIQKNVNEVLTSANTNRQQGLYGAISKLPEFTGWDNQEIDKNLKDVFKPGAKPEVPKPESYSSKFISEATQGLTAPFRAVGTAGKEIAAGFQDIGAPVQPETPAWTQRAARAGGAIANIPVQGINAAVTSVIEPLSRSINAISGGAAGKAVNRFAGGLASTPIPALSSPYGLQPVSAPAPERDVTTFKDVAEKGAEAYSGMTPAEQANIRTFGRGAGALFMGVPAIGAAGVAKAGEMIAPTVEKKLVKAAEDFAEAAHLASTKGIQPLLKKSPALSKKFRTDVKETLETVAEHKDLITPEGGKPPETIAELRDALPLIKKQVFDKYAAEEVAAGKRGVTFDESDLAKLVESNAKVQTSGLTGAAKKESAALLDEYMQLVGMDPTQVSERLQQINRRLTAAYTNPAANTEITAIDKAMSAHLREALDNKIEKSMEQSGYAELRKKYGALKAVEQDINKQADKLARKADKGFFDITDMLTNGEIAMGILTLNPAMVAKGVAGRATKELIKYHNSPNRLIKNALKKAYDVEDLKRTLDPTRGVKNVEQTPEIAAITQKEAQKIPIAEEGAVPEGEAIRPSRGKKGVLEAGGTPERFSIREEIRKPETKSFLSAVDPMDNDAVRAVLKAKGLNQGKINALVAETNIEARTRALENILGTTIPRKGTAGMVREAPESTKLPEPKAKGNKEELNWLNNLSDSDFKNLYKPTGPDISSAPSGLQKAITAARESVKISEVRGKPLEVSKLAESAKIPEVSNAINKLGPTDEFSPAFRKFWNDKGKTLGVGRATLYSAFKTAYDNKRKEMRKNK